MKKRFTDEDIIRFLYDEMSQAESESLLTALVSDESLWQRYEMLQEVAEQLSSVSYNPSEDSMDMVRAYVRASRHEPSEATPEIRSTSFVGKHRLQLGQVSINLQAVIGVALGIFLLLTVAGSAYKLTRQKFDNPNTGKLVQVQPTQSVDQPNADFQFNWEMDDIDQELEKVKEGLELLEENSLL